MAIATEASVGLAETAATTVIFSVPAWIPEHLVAHRRQPETDGEPGREEPAARPSRLPAFLTAWRTDTMVRNSFALMLSTGLQAALGFTFWIVMAHLFSTADVGVASSLLSATSLLAYFSLLGMNATLIRFLPTAEDSNALITSAVLVVSCSAAVLSVSYALLTPVIAPRLSFIDQHPVQMAGFIVLTAAAAINLLTDSVFMASRKALYCALTDGVIGGVSKIIVGVLLAGTGAFGLFTASIGGIAIAAAASLVLIVTAFHWRPSLRPRFGVLRPLLRFSSANYVSNALNLLPSVIVPIVAVDRLGTQAAAYYFVAFQIAALLYSSVWAVEAAFFAEGSQGGVDWHALRRRSRRLAIKLFVPAGVVLALSAHWVLLAFGVKYSHHATVTLQLLAAAVIPIAICNWSWTVLKLSGRLTALIVSNVVYSAGISGAAWVLASRGLTGLSAAWLVGASVAAVVATVPAALTARKSPPRHRVTQSPARALGQQDAGRV